MSKKKRSDPMKPSEEEAKARGDFLAEKITEIVDGLEDLVGEKPDFVSCSASWIKIIEDAENFKHRATVSYNDSGESNLRNRLIFSLDTLVTSLGMILRVVKEPRDRDTLRRIVMQYLTPYLGFEAPPIFRPGPGGVPRFRRPPGGDGKKGGLILP